MGYINGKTDLDLILDGDASDDENELLSTTQVSIAAGARAPSHLF